MARFGYVECQSARQIVVPKIAPEDAFLQEVILLEKGIQILTKPLQRAESR